MVIGLSPPVNRVFIAHIGVDQALSESFLAEQGVHIKQRKLFLSLRG